MLMGLSILDSKIFMIKFSALVCLCHEKIYKLRFSSPLSLLLANFDFSVINTALPQVGTMRLGRVAQRESTSLTSRGSLVQSQSCPPPQSTSEKLWIYRRHGSDLVFYRLR